MTKVIFSFVILIAVVAVGIWLFARKNETVNNANLNNTLATPTLASTPTPSESNQPQSLQVQDLRMGTGTVAKAGQVITVNYVGTLADGTKFDSSYDRKQPFSFILGGGMVIKGWDMGLVGMKVGGKRKLIIPPDLAYGQEGRPPVIPANSILIFEVELLAVQAPKK